LLNSIFSKDFVSINLFDEANPPGLQFLEGISLPSDLQG